MSVEPRPFDVLWEVTIRERYYGDGLHEQHTGRGSTPEEALEELERLISARVAERNSVVRGLSRAYTEARESVEGD